MKKEEWVLLPFPAANRDPEAFDRPDEVILDREENRHSAFGLGPHRCAGPHLARMELRVALEEGLGGVPACSPRRPGARRGWRAASPGYELPAPGPARGSGGQGRVPPLLPIKINR